MKHIKMMTVAKANALEDIGQWFEDAWKKISEFFKGLFGG
jgi:hypothetical protein